eukprot:911110_1
MDINAMDMSVYFFESAYSIVYRIAIVNVGPSLSVLYDMEIMFGIHLIESFSTRWKHFHSKFFSIKQSDSRVNNSCIRNTSNPHTVIAIHSFMELTHHVLNNRHVANNGTGLSESQ